MPAPGAEGARCDPDSRGGLSRPARRGHLALQPSPAPATRLPSRRSGLGYRRGSGECRTCFARGPRHPARRVPSGHGWSPSYRHLRDHPGRDQGRSVGALARARRYSSVLGRATAARCRPARPVPSRGGRHCHDRDARARHRSPLADPLMGRGGGPAMAWITGPRDKFRECRHRLAGRRYAVHAARTPSVARLRRRGGGVLVGGSDGHARWNEQACRSHTRNGLARDYLRLPGDRRRVGRSLDGGPRCAADQSRRRNSRRRRAPRGELVDVRTLAVAWADIRSARGAGHHCRIGPSGSCCGTRREWSTGGRSPFLSRCSRFGTLQPVVGAPVSLREQHGSRW